MERFTRLEIIAEDRIGITSEILNVIYKSGINLNSLEVFPRKVCVKIDKLSDEETQKIINELRTITGVYSVGEIELLNFENNERKLLAIIDAIDEGVVAVNRDFKVELFNNYCEGVFNARKEEVLGQDIRLLMGPDSPLVGLMRKGEACKNREVFTRKESGQIHFIINGRAIKDDNEKIIGAVASIKDIHKAIELANAVVQTVEGAFKDIIGNSKAIETVKKLCMTVAKSDSTTLLRGGSGTGKELFAKAIHHLSERRNRPFVAINCAAVPDSLIESELFGYVRGSFTGAVQSGKDGLFQEADGGTLFLDEIGELSVQLQAKLLRVLQEGVIRKIGSNREEAVNVRIIAATNKNLEDMMRHSLFREDLFYRLNVMPIYLPPLRERLEDIPLLVNHFISINNKKLKRQITGVDEAFIMRLLQYSWPGNVRELQNVIERAMILCDEKILTLRNLTLDLENYGGESSGQASFCSSPQTQSQAQPQTQPQSLNSKRDLNLRAAVELSERRVIEQALAQSKSLRGAARLLGISHTALLKKIKKYGR